MTKIRTENIQGMILKSYKNLNVAQYLFLTFSDTKKTKDWIGKSNFQYSNETINHRCMNIAFSSSGLAKLGITINEENGFSRAFIEGMDTKHRNRILGDYGTNASTDWDWGKHEDDSIHAILILFDKNKNELAQFVQEERIKLNDTDISEFIPPIESSFLEGQKEHFGFKDGISQPAIKGLHQDRIENMVAPGEFILGYLNEYNKESNRPFFRENNIDFGMDGSYMVFRQLEQNVPEFWKTLCSYFGGVEKGKEQGIELASKIVGRRPNGNPLSDTTALPPIKDQNNFKYYHEDQKGFKCPLGSHIRRTNPRDSLSNDEGDTSIKEAIDATNKHRILRRGRPYGKSLSENMSLDEMMTKLDASQEKRGLNFICFNTDIERQFEFVQQTWANNMKFHNLYNDVDPIIGVQNGGKDEEGKNKIGKTQFEIQQEPVRKRYKGIPPFITVKGGGYFFMAGKKAMEFLSKQID